MQYHGSNGYNETFWYEKNLQGDVVAVYDSAGVKMLSYTYDAWGNATPTYYDYLSSSLDSVNPFKYRGYYYDNDLGLYYLNSRYYDAKVGRFINADSQINADILGNNLFAYCGNNPVTRADDTGHGWWVVAGVVIGLIAGGVTKFVSNEATSKQWNSGLVGAAIGGAVYGGVATATGNCWAAGYASAAAEVLINEGASYVPGFSQFNGEIETKKITIENLFDSAKSILNYTAVSGTISGVTGKIAGKIVPTNNGWFKPQKFVSSFVGKYAIKSELQTLTQSGLLFGVAVFEYLFDMLIKQGQQVLVTFFTDTALQSAR